MAGLFEGLPTDFDVDFDINLTPQTMIFIGGVLLFLAITHKKRR